MICGICKKEIKEGEEGIIGYLWYGGYLKDGTPDHNNMEWTYQCFFHKECMDKTIGQESYYIG